MGKEELVGETLEKIHRVLKLIDENIDKLERRVKKLEQS